jgi:hypothetical protein
MKRIFNTIRIEVGLDSQIIEIWIRIQNCFGSTALIIKNAEAAVRKETGGVQ